MAKPIFDLQTTQRASLTGLIEPVAGGIVSKPLLDTGPVKQVLFALDAGQELSEHSSPYPATVHVLDGSVTFGVDRTDHLLRAGDWLAIKPGAPHRARADQPTRLLLTLIKG